MSPAGSEFATEVPERVARLRERALAGPDTPVGCRAAAYCRAALEHAHEPLTLRRAHGLAGTLRSFPVVLPPDQRLAGTHLFGERAGIDSWFDFPEFAVGLWDAPGDRLRGLVAAARVPEEQRQPILALIGRGHLLTGTPWAPAAPEEVRRQTDASVFFGGGGCLNHSVRDYALVLREGFGSLATRVDDRLASLRIEDPGDLRAWDFLRAASIVAHAACDLGPRHAEAARTEHERTGDPEMIAIAEACAQVPAGPARSFREAIQALWFAHTITCCEEHINANSLGRLDQILYPYYERDRAAGLLSEEEALKWLLDLWLILYRDYDVQQAVLGGVDSEGRDATNDLTYLMLEATRRLGLVRCLSVRLHRDTPRALLERSAEVVGQGGGIPFFFNDEAILPALVEKGIPLEEARDYAVIGCVEITVPGKTNPHAVSHNVNLAKCLELALNDGLDPRTGIQAGPHTGFLEGVGSVGEIWDAYTLQVEHMARCGVFVSNAGELDQTANFPLPYQSLLTEDCIARGRDIAEGGARYNYHSCSAAGTPNVADSLAALDRVVFQEARATLAEVREALLADFEGHEALRQALLHRGPKYGNDQSEVDSWAARVSEHYCRTMAGHRTPYGGSFHVHLFSFVWHVDPFGRTTGALPDGRRAGEPLAYSLSPMQGRDERGLTAALKSLAQIPHELAAASSSAILELSPRFLEEEGRESLVSLLESAIGLGIGQLQFNVTTRERLFEAQRDPERFGNLVVRVSGFSQRFSLLSREMQDHIIARTKHEG